MAIDSMVADRMSDQIVGIINTELRAMQKGGEIEPQQILIGLLLPILGFAETMPKEGRPPDLQLLLASARAVVENLADSLVKPEH